ncbi:FimV/HubP family polar landmark protein [Methylomagnum ishizawai]|uniref:FimV/HubP family polar landmark protein n=1 Tax=Methylomagnum ishizawai TaxID=1760988 RepID=UPI001C81AEEF|nr:FimV/HubP family polar landmark protein [Methylomagnum ishizawai]
MHKISRTVALIGLLSPMGVNALGIGDIHLHSALDQALVAEIPLVLSGNDTLADVKVSLASPEAFAKAGLDRQYFLTKLRFTPTQTANGNYVIQVSSREAITEPFMDFLVEVNWPQGRLLREFTVLLDPPSSLQERVAAEIDSPAMQRPGPRTYERVAEIRRGGEPAPRPPRPAALPAPRPAAAPPPPPSADQLTDQAYGPVRRDETLWSIARALNQDPGVSQEQMMLALYRANPQAFSGYRMNGLKAGAVLRLPSRDFIARLAPGQARSEFTRQQAQGTGTAAYDTGGPQLKLTPPPEARPRNQGGLPGGDTPASRAKSEQALEVAESAKQETEDLRSQLAQLRQQLGDIQRLLTLKDEQIAGLQAQRGAPATPPPPKAAVAETPVQPAPVSKPEPAAPTPPPAAVQPPSKPNVPPVAKPTAPAKPVTPPAPVPVAETPFDFSPYLYGGAALGLVGFGVMLLIRWRNAKIAATESILLAAEREGSPQHIPLPTPKALEETPEPIITTKSSFLSEFTPSDFDALGSETDEVDPVSEADVYLAYGRYKQAEELIRHAIQQHPDRDECKLKLLEIYYATENRAAFESYARELKGQRKHQQEDFWDKVEEMGRELLADSDLFHATAPAAPRTGGAEPAKSSVPKSSPLGSLDLSDELIDDLRRFEIEFMEGGSEAGDDAELGFLSLDGLDADDTAATPAPARAAEAKTPAPAAKEPEQALFDALEFDLDFLKAADTEPQATPHRDTGPVGELENLIPFSLDLEPAPEPEESLLADHGSADKTIDDILRELTGQIGQEPAETTSEAGPAAERAPLGRFDFDLDLLEPAPTIDEIEEFQAPAPTDLEPEVQEQEEDLFAGLTDMDQFETKLDLAKAYADMEDEDSAREILMEVATHGNDRQKAEATALLDKLDGNNTDLSLAGQRGRRG